MNRIKKFICEYKARRRAEFRDRIDANFSVCECNGNIFIKCNGVAVWRTNDLSKASDIIGAVDRMRECAKEYIAVTRK